MRVTMKASDLYTACSQSLEELEHRYQTSLSQGLTTKQVASLHAKYGANTVREKTPIWGPLIKRQLNSSFTYLLIAIAIISFFIESRMNAAIILLIVVVNALLNIYQEYKAIKAAQFIQKRLAKTCVVIRDGKRIVVSHEELVPGDIIMLTTGNYVPADARIVDGSITVDQAVLTGESHPIAKDAQIMSHPPEDKEDCTNLIFMGTMITSGTGHALIIATGEHTFFGKVVGDTLLSIQQSGFQERLDLLTRYILYVIAISMLLLFGIHIAIKGDKLVEFLLFSLTLVIGLVPEVLPTVVTFALSSGALKLAKENVIVKRLSAIEDLGSTTLLCTDKTGTLTENKMAVVSWCAHQQAPLALYSYLASEQKETGSFDKAIAQGIDGQNKVLAQSYAVVDRQPFEAERKYNAVIVTKGSERLLILKGALEEIRNRCNSLHYSSEEEQWFEQQAEQGNRILAVAYKEQPSSFDESGLVFAGCIAFSDPIKPTTRRAIKKAHNLGVDVKMITGDSKEVGLYVAHAVQLAQDGDSAITGAEFDQLSPQEKKERAKECVVFVRFSPQQKAAHCKNFQRNRIGCLFRGWCQ